MSSEYAVGTIRKGVYRGILGILCILSMLTPFGESLDSTLTLHMTVQHFFYITGGFLLASCADLIILGASKFSTRLTKLYSGLMRVNASVNRRGLFTFLVAGVLTAYWHIPGNFDAAVLNDSVHIIMHLTFTIVGGLIFIGAGLMTGRMRHAMLLVPGKAMGIFGAFLLFTTLDVYPVYPFSQQAETGLAMVIMMLLMDAVIVPYWLYRYFRRPAPDSMLKPRSF